MKINKEWHEKNRLPEYAGIEMRKAWHLEHAKHCECAPIPEELLKAIEFYQHQTFL